MKKFVASVGLVAVGASGLQLASAQGLSNPDPSKPWAVSLALRGFYDSNINTVPGNFNLQGYSKDSFGFQVTPSVGVGIDKGPTTASLIYTYSMKWYENKPYYNTDNYDSTHTFDANLTHNFNERYNVAVHDSFVIGQEPDVLRAGNTFSTFQRISGDNIRNYGGITFGAELTREVGLELGYDNAYYNYADDSVIPGYTSAAALLNRIEHSAHVDARWTVQPQTVLLLGYRFGMFDYSGDQVLYTDNFGNPFYSDVRNVRSQYGYVGVDHNFRPDFSASLRAGIRYSDFYNDPNDTTDTSPYVKFSLRYHYLPDSFVEGGFSYDIAATDLTGFVGDSFTYAANTATVYALISHKLMPKLTANVTGQFQNSDYQGGLYDGQNEQFLLAGVNLNYAFDKYLSAEAGYNFDELFSDLGRGFNRNRVYIGLRASY